MLDKTFLYDPQILKTTQKTRREKKRRGRGKLLAFQSLSERIKGRVDGNCILNTHHERNRCEMEYGKIAKGRNTCGVSGGQLPESLADDEKTWRRKRVKTGKHAALLKRCGGDGKCLKKMLEAGEKD